VSIPYQDALIAPLESTARQQVLSQRMNARTATRAIMAWDLESRL